MNNNTKLQQNFPVNKFAGIPVIAVIVRKAFWRRFLFLLLFSSVSGEGVMSIDSTLSNIPGQSEPVLNIQ